MIFFQILLFFVSILFISLSISGYGSLINLKIKNFFLNLFLGFIIISFLITLIHFFLKIELKISFLIFMIGLFIFIKKNRINFLFFIKKTNIKYLIIIFSLIPMYISQKYHEDFGYYHLPYAIAFLEEKIIFGFANIDQTFVYNSIWLNISSIFFLNDKNYDFLTLPTFILFISFTIFSLQNILNLKKINISDYYLVVLLFYFILKFTRISEFGVDIPSLIFSILGIYYFIKFYETNFEIEKKNYFYLNFTFSVFAILIKLSVVPIIFLTIVLYLKNFKILKFYILNTKFLINYLFILIFFAQQFIYTGCFFFPTKFTCLNVSWFNSDYLKLSKQLELINKSYSSSENIYSPIEYLSNFTWFPFWLKRNYTEILEHLGTIVLPVLFFAFFLKNKSFNKKIFSEKKIIYLFVFFNLIFWLNFSPVYRFGIHIFATLSFIILIDLLISKKFSKKIFTIFISIFLLFSFSKNIFRINNSDSIFIGIQKIENLYLSKEDISNKHVKIYYPDVENNKNNGWQGRLCWNTPFICSYNNLDITKKNGYLIINKLPD